MFKTIGFAALAAIAALVLGFGARAGTSTQTAHADTTDVSVVACEFIAGGVDGDTTDAIDEGDVAAACGFNNTPLPAVAPATVGIAETGAMCANAIDDDLIVDGVANDGCPQSIAALADTIGDEDGALSKDDFNKEDHFDENWDDNQISTDCWQNDGAASAVAGHVGPGALLTTNANAANVLDGTALTDFASGMACTLDVFTFVDRREPTAVDLPAGLVSLENGLEDFTCKFTYSAAANPLLLGTDNDCETAAVPLNSDGVVLFHVQIDPDLIPGIGAVMPSRVSQSAVEQAFDINVVGPANDIKLTLGETLIETNANTPNVTACRTGTKVTEGIAPPTSTTAWAVPMDRNNNELTRVPVYFKVTPPEDHEIAEIGLGDLVEEVTSNTFFSLHPDTAGLPNAAYVVICGGKETGVAIIRAEINLVSCSATGCSVLSSRDKDDQEITVGGPPSSNVLTAEASTIKCDGTEKSTITAKVTDSNGDDVADGVPVNFSVVALGTANPINTTTVDGKATSVITPLSNSSAGVTVIVTAGDNGIADVVQTSVRVDCALPLATQPTLAPPAPTPRSGIGGPDTGSGGYLNQSSSNGFPMWTLIALALGSVTLVAGGMVTRRSGK